MKSWLIKMNPNLIISYLTLSCRLLNMIYSYKRKFTFKALKGSYSTCENEGYNEPKFNFCIMNSRTKKIHFSSYFCQCLLLHVFSFTSHTLLVIHNIFFSIHFCNRTISLSKFCIYIHLWNICYTFIIHFRTIPFIDILFSFYHLFIQDSIFRSSGNISYSWNIPFP